MKFSIKNMPIRKRILSVFIVLSLFLVVMMTLMFGYTSVVNSKENYQQLSRQTANGLAFMPALTNAMNEENYSELQGIIERVRLQAENPFVTVVDRDGIYLIHPHADKVGTKTESNLNQVLLFGSYVSEEAEGIDGPAIMTTAPIYEEIHGGERVIGAVTVEYLKEDIHSTIVERLLGLLPGSLIGIAVLLGGALFLARTIQEDTLGLEPARIANLFSEREAILNTVKEGIIAIDQKENISIINPSAKSFSDSSANENDFVEALGLQDTLSTGNTSLDEERTYNGHTFITNRLPLHQNQKIVGAICSFREKTDMKQLQETLLQLEGYSDGLRAQTHEYKNKLYVLMGLLQLKKYDEALQMIEEETSQRIQTMPILQAIEDPGAQAVLLGKMAKAAEKKIAFTIDEESQLQKTNIAVTDMAIMLGNLLDNAMEAVLNEANRKIEVMITDIGQEIVMDILDSGPGVPAREQPYLFNKGYSSKGKSRGYGLDHVSEVVTKYHGTIEVSSPKEGGAVFSIYLPK